MTYPLGLVEFESWLLSKKEDDVVGIAIMECKTKDSEVDVSDKFTEIGYLEYLKPAWVNSFVNYVNDLVGGDVTSKEALEISNNLHICTVCNKYNPEGKNCGKENCDW